MTHTKASMVCHGGEYEEGEQSESFVYRFIMEKRYHLRKETIISHFSPPSFLIPSVQW